MKDWLLVMILGAIPFSIGLVWLIVISMTIPHDRDSWLALLRRL